jgi:hypothetical protein
MTSTEVRLRYPKTMPCYLTTLAIAASQEPKTPDMARRPK